MAKINYPSPCEKCAKSGQCSHTTGGNLPGCEKWKTWFLWWWKRFRYYAVAPQKKPGTWTYYHPEEIKDKLRTPPCAKCEKEECYKPCKKYLRWYDMRMEFARKKAGL